MTRDKALQAMDRFVAMGYAVKLYESDMHEHVHFVDGEMTSRRRQLEITALSLDKIDLRAIIEAADDLGLDVGFGPFDKNVLQLTDQPTEEEQHKQALVGNPRRHPR